MNPFHQVPTLDDDGVYVYQSNAIARYLLGSKDTAAFPADVKKRVPIDVAHETITVRLTPHIATYCFHRFFAARFTGQPDEAAAKAAEAKIAATLTEFEGIYFKDAPGAVVGKENTVADAFLYAMLTHLESFGSDFSLEPYPKVRAFMAAQRESPVVQKVYESWPKVVEYLE